MHLGGQQGPGSGVPARPLLLQSTGVRSQHTVVRLHALCARLHHAANSPHAASTACDTPRHYCELVTKPAAHASGRVQLAGMQPLHEMELLNPCQSHVCTPFTATADWTRQANLTPNPNPNPNR